MAQTLITLISVLSIIGCNGYLQFLSSNSRAIAPDMSQMDTIGTGSFSISVWFNADYSANSPTSVFLSTRSQGQPLSVCNTAISSILVGFHPNWSVYSPYRPFIQLGCNFVAYNAPQLYTNGDWQHLVITRDYNANNGEYTLTYYMNAVNVYQVGPVASGNIGTNIQSIATSQGIYLGDDYTSNGYVGKLTQLSFWKRALKMKEINKIYKKGCGDHVQLTSSDISFVDLLHYYPLNEDSDFCTQNGMVYDVHNGNHAVLSSTSDPICVGKKKSVKTIDLSCRTITGDTVMGAGEISRAKCPRRTLLVSCGIDGWHNVGGTRVRPSKDGVCEAELSEDITTTQPYGVAAVANCCRFPQAAGASAITKLSSAGRKVEAMCPKPSSLTGCTVDYDSGSTNNIKGSYAGKAVIAKVERNTRNTCTGQARDGSTDVVAGAQCIKFSNSKYELDCVAVTKYGTRDDLTEANTCPTGTQLLSCMTYSTTLTLDDWHIQTGPTCYVQQDNYDEQYANGVCCKLIKNIGSGYDEEDDEELFDSVISVDEDDKEEGYMFVHDHGVDYSETGDKSTDIALIASIVFLLVIGFGLYRYCYGDNGGYKRLATDDNDALLTRV